MLKIITFLGGTYRQLALFRIMKEEREFCSVKHVRPLLDVSENTGAREDGITVSLALLGQSIDLCVMARSSSRCVFLHCLAFRPLSS